MTCLIPYTHICNEYNIEENFNKIVAYNVERVKFKGTMTKWPVHIENLEQQEPHKTARRHRH